MRHAEGLVYTLLCVRAREHLPLYTTNPRFNRFRVQTIVEPKRRGEEEEKKGREEQRAEKRGTKKRVV